MFMPHRQKLTPELLIHAYCQGVFPMATGRRGRIAFYSPDPRAILPLDRFHISHSLRRRVRKGTYRITRDRVFDTVIRQCAKPRPNHPETWINEEIIDAYHRLHALGLAHSVEAWTREPADESSPAGGLYGVAIGGAFFGESMFSRAVDASKVCLVHLVAHLRERGFTLLDVQFTSPHMERFGVIEIPRKRFHRLLEAALGDSVDASASRW